MNILKIILISICSFSAGVSVGISVISFLVILQIIPRLIQIIRNDKHIFTFEIVLIMGAVFSTITYLTGYSFELNNIIAIILGLFIGIFIGMLAGALVEVLNVIPIISKRMGIEKYVRYILISLTIGKVAGSLYYWLLPNLW